MLQFMLGAPEWPGDQSLMFSRIKMIEMLLNVVHIQVCKNIWRRRELINYDMTVLHKFIATHLSWWGNFNLLWYHHLPITETFIKGNT